jgi:hypothetical protein
LKALEMKHGLNLHVVHVTGTQMIDQGSDGLSRADHSQGVMAGEEMEKYIPLHLSALQREPKLTGWLEDVFGDLRFKTPLEPAHLKRHLCGS